MPPSDELAAALDSLHHSDQRLVRTVDSLDLAQWAEPSLCAGWSRGALVGHLALNAEGFTRALTGLLQGEPVPVYDSDEARDAGIAALGAEEPRVIRERLFAATAGLRDTFGALTADHWAATVRRTPEGLAWPVAGLVATRRREVEIHHADLDAGYSRRDWPDGFARDLVQHYAATSPAGADLTGDAADVAWRLSGRS